jgi:GTP:adenosylcobinamide-phosphate guanylyltransferase
MKWHGLVLAGGEGSRLRADGISVPKALVEVAGRPQARRVLEALTSVGCVSLTCAARDDVPGLVAALGAWPFTPPVQVVACRTPTSLHTLVRGFEAAPPGPVLCSMVDTVMRAEDWLRVAGLSAAGLRQGTGVGAVIAVTPFVNDKSALYVTRRPDGQVQTFGRSPGTPVCVTGGVYAFAAAVRPLAAEALQSGVSRMRGFLDWLLGRQVGIATVEVDRIIDLDRATDVALADAWLGGGELRPTGVPALEREAHD